MAVTAPEVWDDLIALITERTPDYNAYHDYYSGEQSLPVDSAEFQSKFGTFFASFRDNLARPVIESAEGRVRIEEFGDGSGIAADAQDVWDRNRMKVESRWVHTQAMVKGEGYVIVLPRKDKKAGVYPQISQSIAIVYDEIDPREKKAAIKWWVTERQPAGQHKPQSYVRVNLYFANRIERYVSTQQSDTLITDFEKYEEYLDEGAWKTTHKVGQVPVFQFSANYDQDDGRGRSDLADAAPLIDGVVKTFLDMMTASEFTAAPQRWATGVEIPLDPKTGEPIKQYTAGTDKLWTAPNEAAKFGQFAAGDLSAYKDAIGELVEHLGFVSRTPTYALMREANYPSGESLRSAEAPLRSRVSDHQDAFGQVWAEVMAAALGLDGVTVDEEDIPELLPRWLPPNAPFATREHLEELKVLVEVLGVPEEMAWRRAGFTNAEIADMKSMREEEATLGVDALAIAQADAIIGGAPPASPAGALPATPDAAPPNTATGAPQ
jgi:hypothetical protein